MVDAHFSRTLLLLLQLSQYSADLNSFWYAQLQPFNGLFSRTTWVSWYQKGKTSLDLNEARNDGVLGRHWHQLDHMQTICTLVQTDNHTNTSSRNIYRLFLMPNQHCQSTEGESTEEISRRTMSLMSGSSGLGSDMSSWMLVNSVHRFSAGLQQPYTHAHAHTHTASSTATVVIYDRRTNQLTDRHHNTSA